MTLNEKHGADIVISNRLSGKVGRLIFMGGAVVAMVETQDAESIFLAGAYERCKTVYDVDAKQFLSGNLAQLTA